MKLNKVEKTILRQIEVISDSIKKGFNTIVAIKDYYNAYRNIHDPVMDSEDITNLLIFMKNVNKVISNSDGEYYLI